MNISIRQRIYLSFFLLVFLFVINGFITIIILNNIKNSSTHLSKVVNPSIESLIDLRTMVLESKIYTTSWVFLRFHADDKDSLRNLHLHNYTVLKSRINTYSAKWQNKRWVDTLTKVCAGIEELLVIEKEIMGDLKNFKDYDDPVIKLEAERKIEEEILPRAASLMISLDKIRNNWINFRIEENAKDERFSMKLRLIIVVLSIAMICIGLALSLYMAKVIIRPVNTIRHIVNDLGKGIIRMVNGRISNNEIGDMLRSVNNLSEKLHSTAAFASEIGSRNFNSYFQPLSTKDTLGKALVAMRDNLKTSDESLNEAQHIAKLGSWELDLKTNKLFWSDELYNIFDADPSMFTPSYERYLDFVHPEDRELTANMQSKFLEDHNPFSYECRIITEKNNSKIVCIQGKLSKNDNDGLIKLTGIMQDITDRKKAEKKLADVNSELSILFNSIDEIFFSVNMVTLEVIQVSATCDILYGYNQSDFLANSELWLEIIHPDDKHIIAPENEMMRRGEQVNNQYRIIRKDKAIRWVETKITPTLDINGNLVRVDGVTRDITERINTEEALKRSEAFNKGVLTSLSSHIAVIDDSGLIIAVNKAWENFSKANGETKLTNTSIGSNYFDVCKTAINAGDEIAKQALEGIQSVLNRRESTFEFEYPCDSPTEKRWFSLHVMNFESDTPKVVLSHQDISERKFAEEKLILSEKYNRNLFDQSTVGLALSRMDGTLEDVNDAYAKITGYSIDECKIMSYYEVTPEKYKEQELEQLKSLELTGRYGPYEKEYFHKNGHLVPVRLSGTILEKDGIKYIWSCVEDITDRKKAETQLKNSEESYRQIVETAQEGIWMIDENKKTKFVNKRVCEILGYSPVEMIGNDLFYFMDEEGKKLAAASLEKQKKHGTDYLDFKFLTKEGAVVWTYLATSAVLDDDGNYIGGLAMVTDMTERIKTEESNKLKAELLNAVGQSVIATDMKGIVNFWNKAAEEIYGWTQQEAIDNSIVEMTAAHQSKVQGIEIMDELSQGHSWSGELILQRKDGSTFPAFVTNSPIYDQYHNLSGIIGVSSNITERKKAETQLKNSEERYRQIVETAQEGIWLIDENNNTTFINKKMGEIIEYSPEEIMGKQIHSFMDEGAKRNAKEQIERRKQGISETHESTFITKNGKAVWTSLSTNPIFDDTGIYKGALAMVTDITKRKNDEKVIQQSQARLAVNNHELEQKNKELEQFAYVASHDLQEPLRTTTSFVEIFKQQYYGKLDPAADKYLNYISQASDRMSVLIKDLLDFSRIGNNKDQSRVDCNTILKDVIEDIDKAISDSSAVISAGELPVIMGYPTEIKQLFQNLTVNAIKFRKPGVAPEIKISANKAGNQWNFSFADNGIGIDQAYNEKIFVIFQRLHTRNEYEGSGIGLSHCKKIVELHHGRIWVNSTPGLGSTFYFSLPINNSN